MHVAGVRRVAVHKVVQVPAGGLRSLGDPGLTSKR